jgi:CHRD domain.|nr:CHRD domain-containing protein [uncultured Steroidobacter sp.]
MKALSALISTFALGVSAVSATELRLMGAEEVPQVTTSATGIANIQINDDKTVSGSVKTTGVDGIAAHIHLAPVGKNGPPIITLVKSGNDVWSVPEGAKLTDEQYASYKAGNLYVNVHSAKHKGGEIRAQLEP